MPQRWKCEASTLNFFSFPFNHFAASDGEKYRREQQERAVIEKKVEGTKRHRTDDTSKT
jgi:hypothetical protein